jgi:hypothetical protein
MTTSNYQIGQKVNYVNGCAYVGTIVALPTTAIPYYTIIDCKAGMALWNAGYNVGANVVESQIKSLA